VGAGRKAAFFTEFCDNGNGMLGLAALVGLMAGLMAPPIPALPGETPAEPEVATIIDSGSTNRPGFRMVVDRSGSVEMTATPRRGRAPQEQTEPLRRTLAPAVLKRFRADLEAARPMSSLPAVRCAKSVSFGSTRTVVLEGEQTPDLNCGDGGSTAMHNLIADVSEIVALFR
jgi:hypothetical protein